jgi:hypothetical protein
MNAGGNRGRLIHIRTALLEVSYTVFFIYNLSFLDHSIGIEVMILLKRTLLEINYKILKLVEVPLLT